MTETMTAAEAIAASIERDEIVHLDWTSALEEDLLAESEDGAEYESRIGPGETHEFWGSIGAGGAWCVHLHGAPATTRT
jgi:hypothetical protein